MNILVVMPTEEIHREMLRRAAPGGAFVFTSAREVTRQQIQDAEIIIGNAPAALIAGSRKLKLLQLNSAGADGYTAPGVLPEGCILCNASGAYGLAISEHMLGGLLCLMKKLDRYRLNQEKHLWRDEGSVTSIFGSKTLVVGYGNLGSEFALRMRALGSTVIGIRRNKTEKPRELDALYQMDALEDCLKDADIVASCLPGTRETYHVWNEKTFAQMRPGTFFLNVGRGGAVDGAALADALNRGHLAGACVDVTEPEPLPPEHPLWEARNILITPHISGAYHLKETHERILKIACENVDAFLTGRPVRNVVDFATGYRRLQ